MKMIKLFLLLFFLISVFSSIPIFSQMENPKAFEGTWDGVWLNTTYQSTGDMLLTVTVDELQQKMNGHWAVGGTVLGLPSIEEFDTELPYDAVSLSGTLLSAYWGTINGTLFWEGTFEGTGVDSPIDGVGTCYGDGNFDSFVCNGFFEFNYWGTDVAGEMTITKQNPINIPQTLTAEALQDGSVLLEWDHDAINTNGFRIDRAEVDKQGFSQIAEISTGENSYNDVDVLGGVQYIYRLAGFNSETESDYSNEVYVFTVVVSISGEPGLPIKYSLEQNYPNPFNPSTTIQFSLPERSFVNLTVSNLLGKTEVVLLNGEMNGGLHQKVFNAVNLSNGIYFINIIADSQVSDKTFYKTIKSLLLK